MSHWVFQGLSGILFNFLSKWCSSHQCRRPSLSVALVLIQAPLLPGFWPWSRPIRHGVRASGYCVASLGPRQLPFVLVGSVSLSGRWQGWVAAPKDPRGSTHEGPFPHLSTLDTLRMWVFCSCEIWIPELQMSQWSMEIKEYLSEVGSDQSSFFSVYLSSTCCIQALFWVLG